VIKADEAALAEPAKPVQTVESAIAAAAQLPEKRAAVRVRKAVDDEAS
jgi:hypothetical protein